MVIREYSGLARIIREGKESLANFESAPHNTPLAVAADGIGARLGAMRIQTPGSPAHIAGRPRLGAGRHEVLAQGG